MYHLVPQVAEAIDRTLHQNNCAPMRQSIQIQICIKLSKQNSDFVVEGETLWGKLAFYQEYIFDKEDKVNLWGTNYFSSPN